MIDFSILLPKDHTRCSIALTDSSSTPRTTPCPPSPRLLQGHGLLFYGPRQCGKSSLAFQAAVNTVVDGGRVLMLCREDSLYSKTPQPFTPLTSLDEATVTRIQFTFTDGWTDACRELALLAAPEDVPDLLLIDDDGWATEGKKTAADCATVALSLLENIAAWMRKLGRPFLYAVVTNGIQTEPTVALSSSRLPLPLGAFPVVFVSVDQSGCARLHALPNDTDNREVLTMHLTWQDGLALTSVS